MQAASGSTVSVTPATPDSDTEQGSSREDGDAEPVRPTLRIEVPEDGVQHLALLSAHTPIALLRRRSLERPPTPPSALLPSTPQASSKAAIKELDAAILSGSAATLTSALQDAAVRSVVNASLADGQFPALVAMCSLGDLPDLAQMCNAMLGAGANPTLQDTSGYTALHWAAACVSSGAPVMDRLLQAGANINAPCKEGETPLHRAARVGRADNVAWLLQHGASVHARNNDLLSPLDVAGVFSGTVSHSHRVLVRAAMLAARPELQTAVYTHADCLAHIHTRDHHQEAPERIIAIMEAVRGAVTPTADVRVALRAAMEADAASSARERKRKSSKARSAGRVLKSTVFGDADLRIVEDFPIASRAQVQLAHSSKYTALLWRLSQHVNKHQAAVPFTPIIQRSMHGLPRDKIKPAEMCDTSFSPGSLQAALRAAGAVVAAVEGVAAGSSRNALCVVRPPGHHAGVDGLIEVPKDIAPHCTSSCGFCILNSVAIGALHALRSVPSIQRVAILDIDVHHGNGTEDIINHVMKHHPELRTKLCFTSVHLYDVAPAMKLAAEVDEAAADVSAASPPTTRHSAERSAGGDYATSATSTEAFPLSSARSTVVSTVSNSTGEAASTASAVSSQATQSTTERHQSLPAAAVTRAGRPKRRRRAKSFDDYEVYQPTPPVDSVETPLPTVPEDAETAVLGNPSDGEHTIRTQASGPPTAAELPPPSKRAAPSVVMPVQLSHETASRPAAVPLNPAVQVSPARPRVTLKLKSTEGPPTSDPAPPRTARLQLLAPEGEKGNANSLQLKAPSPLDVSAPPIAGASPARAEVGSGAGKPPSTSEVDLYSFYPGTGKDDCLPHNIVNCAVQPLWRAKEGPAPLPSPLLAAAASHEQAQAASSAASRGQVAARPLGADRPHVYSTDMSPTCTLSYGAGRAAVRQAISARVVPTLRAFGPDLILLSAGFDGARGDAGNTRNDGYATQGMDLRQEDFEWITAQVMAVSRVCCPGRVVSVLEGGYGQWKLTREKYNPAKEQQGGDGGAPAPSPRSRALSSPSVGLASLGMASALKTPGSAHQRPHQQHSWSMTTPGQQRSTSGPSAFTTPAAPPAFHRTATAEGGGISIGLAPFSTSASENNAELAHESASSGPLPPSSGDEGGDETRTRLVSTLKREPLAANVLAHLKALVYA